MSIAEKLSNTFTLEVNGQQYEFQKMGIRLYKRHPEIAKKMMSEQSDVLDNISINVDLITISLKSGDKDVLLDYIEYNMSMDELKTFIVSFTQGFTESRANPETSK